MKPKKSTTQQKAGDVKPNDRNIFEDGPIIIKGGSVHVRYKRSSFERDPDDPVEGEKHKLGDVQLQRVIIENDATGDSLTYEIPPRYSRNCRVTIKYV